MKRIWNFFSSVWLTITLACAICIVAAWGSFLTVREPRFFRAIDQQILFPWLMSDGVEAIDLSLWIFILIFLTAIFAVNTLVCTLDRVYAILKNRRPIQSFFPHIVHVGFLIALLGHLVSSMAGFRSYGHVLFTGEPIPVPMNAGLSVRLDEMDIKTTSQGQLEDLRTTITILDGERAVKTDDIRINGPVFYNGVAFYHLDQGSAPTGLVLRINGERVTAPLEDRFTAAEEEFAFGDIYPDFAMSRDGRPFTRSLNYSNPYIEVVTRGGDRAYLSLAGPGAKTRIIGKNAEGDEQSFLIELEDFIISNYAVLAIHRDPGIWLIIAGSAVLVVGMILLLFFRGERGELVRQSTQPSS